MANRRAEDTVGKRFFAEVAPCTDAPAFRGRIAALSKAGDEVSFDYSFEFPWGSKRVAVRALFHDDSRWIFVTPIE